MADDTISLSIRLKRADWLRLHDEAARLRIAGDPAPSLQGVIVAALNEYFTHRGEPALDTTPFGRGGPRISGKKQAPP